MMLYPGGIYMGAFRSHTQEFIRCRQLAHRRDEMDVRWVSPSPYRLSGIELNLLFLLQSSGDDSVALVKSQGHEDVVIPPEW